MKPRPRSTAIWVKSDVVNKQGLFKVERELSVPTVRSVRIASVGGQRLVEQMSDSPVLTSVAAIPWIACVQWTA